MRLTNTNVGRVHSVSASTIIWAIRYCRTRYGTYAFGDGLDLILTHWTDLSPNDRQVVRRDMEDVLTLDDPSAEGPIWYEDKQRQVRDLLAKAEE